MFTIQTAVPVPGTGTTERGRFRVEFRHTRNDIGEDGKPRKDWSKSDPSTCRGCTICTISRQDNPPDGPWIEVATGSANCHRSDNWSYATGRTVALARALGKAFRKWTSYNITGQRKISDDAFEVRGIRRLFWDCYHVMSNRPEIVDPGYLFAQAASGRMDIAVEALVCGGTRPPNKVGHVLHQVVTAMRERELESTASVSQAATPEPLQPSSPPESGSSSQPSPR